MTNSISRQPIYKDLDLNFLAHPTTKDVTKKTGDEAIKRSIRNLILTNHYDRPFRHYIGSNVQKLLFENLNSLTANFLKNSIEETIKNYEPRVQLQQVTVDPDYDNNGYKVVMQYIILNTTLPVTTTVFLERIR
jgi:phage baseplate assembly protein W